MIKIIILNIAEYNKGFNHPLFFYAVYEKNQS